MNDFETSMSDSNTRRLVPKLNEVQQGALSSTHWRPPASPASMSNSTAKATAARSTALPHLAASNAPTCRRRQSRIQTTSPGAIRSSSPSESTLEEAIENLCYDYLEETHGGWENNDGGFGEFRIDVAKRTVELEFNGRFTDTCTSNHTF